MGAWWRTLNRGGGGGDDGDVGDGSGGDDSSNDGEDGPGAEHRPAVRRSVHLGVLSPDLALKVRRSSERRPERQI